MLRLIAIVSFVSILAGCGTTPQPSKTQAVVPVEQYREALAVVAAVDYVPFGVTRDGCYARALYMSLELAAAGIPSSATFTVAPAGSLLRLADGTTWQYHVAPMLAVPGYSPMIMDPSMSQAPLRQADWVQAMHGQGAYVYSIPGSHYGYWYGNRVVSSQVVSSLREMPPFRIEDLQHACRTAYRFWGEARGLTDAERAARRQKLVQRTVELGRAVEQRGKISNASGITRYDCHLPPAY